VSVACQALNYGTGCFEGIRAYWNHEREQLYVVKMREHYQRLVGSCRILCIEPGLSVDEMCEVTIELLRREEYRQDVYIRPLAFKIAPTVLIKLTGLQDELSVYTLPLGDYLDTSKGLSLATSSWVRLNDNALPPRGKITGAYANAALASDGARNTGFDEALMLTPDGHVAEASSANLFMVRDGVLVTPPVSAAILEGITRATLIRMAREDFGLTVIERDIDRTEMYVADEVFLCGTGVQVAPVTRVDGRQVGSGRMGPVCSTVQRRYLAACRGDLEEYADWLVAVYPG